MHAARVEPFGELKTEAPILWFCNFICVVLARLNHVSEGPFRSAATFWDTGQQGPSGASTGG